MEKKFSGRFIVFTIKLPILKPEPNAKEKDQLKFEELYDIPQLCRQLLDGYQNSDVDITQENEEGLSRQAKARIDDYLEKGKSAGHIARKFKIPLDLIKSHMKRKIDTRKTSDTSDTRTDEGKKRTRTVSFQVGTQMEKVEKLDIENVTKYIFAYFIRFSVQKL